MRHHHFDHPGSKRAHIARLKSFPVAPFPQGGIHHGIELQDYSEQSGLLCRASLEPDKPLSWHPALRA
jgi:hypothetical protein